MLPTASRVAVLANPTDPFAKPFLQQIEIAARFLLGIEIQTIMVHAPEQLEASFAQIDENRTAAVIVQPSLPRKQAADLALKHHLASVSPAGGFAQMGGLMAYAGKPQDTHREAAIYVDKILLRGPSQQTCRCTTIACRGCSRPWRWHAAMDDMPDAINSISLSARLRGRVGMMVVP